MKVYSDPNWPDKKLLMGYQGSSYLDSGFLAPVGLVRDDVNCRELLELIYLHVRESLPPEVLPASYRFSHSWAGGFGVKAGLGPRDCIVVTLCECRSLVIFPVDERSVTFFYFDGELHNEKICSGGVILSVEDPEFFDDLDEFILEWFRSERS